MPQYVAAVWEKVKTEHHWGVHLGRLPAVRDGVSFTVMCVMLGITPGVLVELNICTVVALGFLVLFLFLF